jgi:hypothetical protein
MSLDMTDDRSTCPPQGIASNPPPPSPGDPSCVMSRGTRKDFSYDAAIAVSAAVPAVNDVAAVREGIREEPSQGREPPATGRGDTSADPLTSAATRRGGGRSSARGPRCQACRMQCADPAMCSSRPSWPRRGHRPSPPPQAKAAPAPKEAKLCLTVCPQIGWVNSAHDNVYRVPECCVLLWVSPGPAQNTHPRRLRYKIYLQAHSYSHNQQFLCQSLTKFLQSSYNSIGNEFSIVS